MAFDQPTRNRLARFVGDARALLTEEFTRQLQHEYGLDPKSGDVADLEKLADLDDARRETARILRATLEHYLAGGAGRGVKARKEALDRIVREQAFTVLNRLCALRMAEARGLVIESIANGYRSRGFQLYLHLAGTALGETGDAYRSYLFSLFDEFALDLPVLFDRFSPQGRLFPRETVLLQLLEQINHPEIEPLWAEDETIGWIYEYFNPVEERRKMRKESSAPRNSRELAVRNQFFTPRYVVEFLTDDTLGRIWYEMTRGETSLKESCRYLVRRPNEVFLAEGEAPPEEEEPQEELSQEELLARPVYIPHRPLKDPREIKMLDPACGSMHFGLYAFDLFERIYAEAWELEGSLGSDAFARSEGLEPLRESYPDRETLLRDLPRLILEHNIHGIDIDPRAVQIAGLSLWLRAQKSWQAQGVKPQDRPQIRRSNVVCAEPMPGDEGLLEQFLTSLRDERLESLIRRVFAVPADRQVRATQAMADALCDLVRTVWKEMELAGEAGSLLKIEEALADAIARSKAEWEEKQPLFRVSEFSIAEEPRIHYLRQIPGEEEDFWGRAEALVLTALQDYAERAENGGGYRRRLFAAEAARGFSFIGVCRKRYDVVLMNPPFGESSSYARDYLETRFPHWNANMLCAFLQRGWSWRDPDGSAGIICDRTVVVKSTYEDFRRYFLIKDDRLFTMADLGWGVLNANVEVTTYVLQHVQRKRRAAFTDLRSAVPEKRGQLLQNRLAALQAGECSGGFIFRCASAFVHLPNAVVGYDLPDFLQVAFLREKSLEDAGFRAYQGHALKADKHFRVWWEISSNHRAGILYRLFNGSGYSPYHTALLNVVIAPRPFEALPKDSATVLRNTNLHGIPGVCFGKRGDFFSAHVLPADHVFTVEGQSIPIKQTNRAYELLGFLNTPLVRLSLNKYCGQHKYSGYVNLLPFRPFDGADIVRRKVQEAVRSGAEARQLDEVQSLFYPGVTGGSIAQCAEYIYGVVEAAKSAVLQCEEFCHEQSLKAFNVSSQERELIEAFRMGQPLPASPIEDITSYDACRWFAAHTWISIPFGCAFGRWDIRFATSEKAAPKPPDPFAPLPICPPGMLQNDQGLPASPSDVPANYPLRISWPGILVDDEGHPEDVERRVREALRVIWKERADAIEQEACEILGVGSLRDYFRNPNGFFDDHLKRYSKSRRYAPIYWPLSTRSGAYTLWLYYHRLTDQTLYTCANDFVGPKLRQVAEEASRLRQKSGRSRDEENELERLVDLELELMEFQDELLRIARFWKPNLNDGVQITAAPLWKLFQHRQWQKRLKETWETLEAGEYDWAHLVISIWPERVVLKCVEDRSLAIAHDVEDLFWVEDVGGWRTLRAPEEEIEEQKRRRRSRARERVRALLAELGRGRAEELTAAQVCAQLQEGEWDDLELALLLWPERVAEKCWDDPQLALALGVTLPSKRTKAARKRFVEGLVAEGCPDLADQLVEALGDSEERFTVVWAGVERGERDDLPLALSLWPDRVVDRCAVDVELAECHGLARFFWCRHPNGVWRRREAPEREIADEIARRRAGATMAKGS